MLKSIRRSCSWNSWIPVLRFSKSSKFWLIFDRWLHGMFWFMDRFNFKVSSDNTTATRDKTKFKDVPKLNINWNHIWSNQMYFSFRQRCSCCCWSRCWSCCCFFCCHCCDHHNKGSGCSICSSIRVSMKRNTFDSITLYFNWFCLPESFLFEFSFVFVAVLHLSWKISNVDLTDGNCMSLLFWWYWTVTATPGTNFTKPIIWLKDP